MTEGTACRLSLLLGFLELILLGEYRCYSGPTPEFLLQNTFCWLLSLPVEVFLLIKGITLGLQTRNLIARYYKYILVSRDRTSSLLSSTPGYT